MEANWNQLIERYLNGELSTEGKSAFETELSKNEALRKELELHQLTQNVIRRAAMRELVVKGGKAYHLKKTLTTSGIVVVVLAVITAAVVYFAKAVPESEDQQNKVIDKELLEDMNSKLEFNNTTAQYFDFLGTADVFLSESGVLLSITENSFLLDGNPYHGKAVVQWQEAQSAAEIVKAGLSTMSGNELLETQGMFSLNAFTPDGKQLDLSKEGIYVQVPVDELKKDMKLFQGVAGKDGNLDWQNPVELERLPKPKSMAEMDLFPPKYEPKLNELKWFADKKKRDSLYLSFDETMPISEIDSVTPKSTQRTTFQSVPVIAIEPIKVDTVVNPISDKTTFVASYASAPQGKTDGLPKSEKSKVYKEKPHIPPSKVLAIWDTKFDQTILATQDFEDRMKFIHNTCDEKVFDLYVEHLNEPLWKLDERAVKMGYKEFQRFADQRVGKRQLSGTHQKNMEEFYKTAVKTIRERGKSEMLKAQQKDREWDEGMRKERNAEIMRNGLRRSQNNAEEAEFNLRSLSNQLGTTLGFSMSSNTFGSKKGQKTTATESWPRPSTLPMKVNLDRMTRPFLASRSSFAVDNKAQTKTATITYSRVTGTLDNYKQFDKTFLYLFPDQVNSYQRVDFVNGTLNYPLNDGMRYSGVIVGMNENGYFLQEIKSLRGEALGTLTLSAVSEREFERRINAMNAERIAQPMEMQSELNWLFKEKANYKVQQQRRENQEFRAFVRPTIYTCGADQLPAIIEPVRPAKGQSGITEVNKSPEFPPGTATLSMNTIDFQNFIRDNVKFPDIGDRIVNGTVLLRLIIAPNGSLSDVELARGIPNCPECDEEATRVARLLPSVFIPAVNQRGSTITSYFMLPIRFDSGDEEAH